MNRSPAFTAVALLIVWIVSVAILPLGASSRAYQGSLSQVERSLEAPEAAIAVGDLIIVQNPNGLAYGLETETGSERWRFDGESVGYFPPYMLGGLLLVGNNAGDLFALDPATGAPRWEITDTIIVYPPVSDGSTMYAGGVDGSLYAFDPASGNQIWSTPLVEWGVVGPSLANGRLFVASKSSGSLIAVDAATGQELWRKEMFGYSHLPPVAVGNLVITGFGESLVFDGATGGSVCEISMSQLLSFAPPDNSGIVYAAQGAGGAAAIRADSCDVVWSEDLSTPNLIPPIVDESIVYVTSAIYRSAAAFDKDTGQKLWSLSDPTAPDDLYLSASEGVAYVAQRSLVAMDGSSGEEFWRISVDGALASIPLRVGEIVVTGAIDGQVYSVDANSGIVLWQFDAGASDLPEGMGPRY